MPKRISQKDITGQKGINLIEQVVLDMGCLWTPTNLEAGIDGVIELRDPISEVVTNCILQVQSKATTKPFDAETDTEFSYYCSQADLDYWLGGNAPVILVRSRPDQKEAYWAHIQERFSTVESRNSKTIRFHKQRDRFDSSCFARLTEVAVPRDSGLYLAPVPKHEVLETNLLPITYLPETYFVAEANFPSAQQARKALKDAELWLDHAWLIKAKNLVSLHDLRQKEWGFLCDQGTVEELPFADWVFTDDDDEKRDLIALLDLALRDTLETFGIRYNPAERKFFFRGPSDLSEKKRTFQGRHKKSARTVFKGYASKSDPGRISYYRHMAFKSGFVRLEGVWCLEIRPTYHFTWNGKRTHPRNASLVSGIKRLDGARSYGDQVFMWASVLGEKDLFTDERNLLEFGKLLTVETSTGINDADWKAREEDTAFIDSDVDSQGDQLSLL